MTDYSFAEHAYFALCRLAILVLAVVAWAKRATRVFWVSHSVVESVKQEVSHPGNMLEEHEKAQLDSLGALIVAGDRLVCVASYYEILV